MGYLPGGSETVLLVEDEPSVKSVMTHVLQELGYTVLEASNGVQAIEVFDQHPGPDRSAVDAIWSGLSWAGKELASRLKEVLPGLKVLYTSGYRRDTVNESLFWMGPIGFIQEAVHARNSSQSKRRPSTNPGAHITPKGDSST